MNRILIALFFFLAFSSNTFSQGERLSDYSFIVVPKQFDFQFEDDQYQLNSLLKFLFNKYGFHAFYENELPDVSRCDGLWAEVMGDPGFIWTKVLITIKDCDGIEIYRTLEGKSKLKDYAKGYTEAMRMAFEDIQGLGIQQKDITLLVRDNGNQSPSTTDLGAREDKAAKKHPLHFPMSKYTNYTKDGKSYLLQKIGEGFSLYEETTEADDGLDYVGKIFVVEGQPFFEDASNNRFIANFDNSENLSIQKEGTTVEYRKAH